MLTMWEKCSHGFGGDISAFVHASPRCEDDSPASGTVAIKGSWTLSWSERSITWQ